MAKKPKNMKAEEAILEQGKGVENMLPDAKTSEKIETPAVQSVVDASHPGSIDQINVDRPEKTKTSAASKLVQASSGAANSGAGLLRGVVFGGGAGTEIGQDVSATTRADKPYKSGSRIGKRYDPINRKLDFNYPELVEVEISQSKPLSETDAKQGYNGNYYNQHAITQRSNGGAPADANFNRSVDLITLDMAYFADGQYNNARESYNEYKAKTFNKVNNSYNNYISIKRGSYMPKELKVTFNAHGAVGLEFVEDDLSNRNLDEATVRLAGDAALRANNRIELDRLEMVNKAGDENDSSYCPLGDGFPTTTAVNSILRDIDTLAGNNYYMSKRKAKMAHAYQINKAAKDGLRVIGPMAEMCNGNIEGQYSTAISPCSESNGRAWALATVDAFKQGSAGLYVAVNDSLSKYTTKSKLLTLPLSFRNAIEIADKNDGFFRASEEFIKDVEHSELFSTIDAPYDPFQPVVLTDKCNVINSISLADTGNVIIDANTTESENEFPNILTYHYESLRNKYNIPVKNFFVKGLHDYFKANASRYRDNLGSAVNGIWTLTIPIQSSVTSFSLWDLVVLASIPYAVPERQKSLVDVLKYEMNFNYPYSGSIALKDVECTNSINFTFTSIDEPLGTKIAEPISTLKVRFPEVFWSVGAYAKRDLAKNDKYHDFMIAQTVLPMYFNQEQFDKRTSDNKLVLGEHASTISYPSTRSGVRYTDLDSIYGMSEEDYRLSLDRMVVYPGYDRVKASVTSGNVEGAVLATTAATGKIDAATSYKYGFTTDGIPCLPYRATYNAAELDPTDPDDAEIIEEMYAECLTIKDVMKTPRELGLHFVVPAGVLTPLRDSGTGYANYRNTRSGYLVVSGPGFNSYLWHTQNATVHYNILQEDEIMMNVAEQFSNTYMVLQAAPGNAMDDFGAVLSISRGMKATATAHTYTLDGGSFDFSPFVTGSYDGETYTDDNGMYAFNEAQVTSDTNKDYNVISFQKYFWSRIQRLPFAVNPYDANCSDLSYEASKQKGNKYDIYDMLYFFGLCGFRASDYEELTYERNKNRISLGMNYVNDPYIGKTMLLK